MDPYWCGSQVVSSTVVTCRYRPERKAEVKIRGRDMLLILTCRMYDLQQRVNQMVEEKWL